MGPLEAYKRFVREHSSLVVNVERLAHWVVWNPERFNGSEFTYEAFNAAVGLLGLYNDSIMSGEDTGSGQTDWGFLLAAVEQVQTLVELRAMQMEERGKMSRYGPLIALELLKLFMRLRMWGACRSHLALESVSPEDKQIYDSEQRLKELLGALVRLRRHYEQQLHHEQEQEQEQLEHQQEPQRGRGEEGNGPGGVSGSGGGCDGGSGQKWFADQGRTGQQQPQAISDEDQERLRHEYNARQAAAAAVRAAVIAPDRPPCACGSSGAALAAARGGGASQGSMEALPIEARESSGATGTRMPAIPPAPSPPAEDPAEQVAACTAAAAEDDAPVLEASAQQGEASTVVGEAAEGGAIGSDAEEQVASPPARALRPFLWGWWGSNSATAAAQRRHLAAGTRDSTPELLEGEQTSSDDLSGSGSGGSGSSSEEAGPSTSGAAAAGGGPFSSFWGPPSRAKAHKTGGAGAGVKWQWWRPAAAAPAASGGCSTLEERLLQRQAGWRLDPSGMDVGDSVIWVGELVHLLRPLIYVCLLKRHGLRSWRPWAASLGVELLSMYAIGTGHVMLQQCSNKRWPPGSTLYSLALLRGLTGRRWTPAEQQELMARRLGLLRYLLRSPCYDSITRPVVARGVGAVRWVPLLGSLGSYALELVDSMQGYYTYVES